MAVSSSDNNSGGNDRLPQMDLSHDSGRGYDPLNELMRAIILRLIDDYNSGGELQTEALEYLEDEDDEYLFSFRSICLHLGLDPEKTRHLIKFPTHRIRTRRRAS